MDRATRQQFIQSVARKNQSDPEGSFILWSRHATIELVNEGWARVLVEQALIEAEVIEVYAPLHRPLPDCLVLGWLPNQIPVHAVIALDEVQSRLLIITVYQPSQLEWESDWRTRK